jgi:hypothetical protein
MQYLECLSAVLQDMALTYQPAERMSVVLRAVMIELRGDNPVDNDFKLYKPKSTLIPTRRSSTMEVNDTPLYKKRQTSRPRAGTGMSKKRSMSMISNITNTDSSIKPPSHPSRFEQDNDRGEGYIMVAPHSEVSSWYPLSEATPGLEHGITTPSSTNLSTSGPRNAWMGAEFDTSDSISQIANVHFPKIPALSETGDMMRLDFMSLGDGRGDWVRDWSSSNEISVGSDIDGFPSQGGFEMGFGGILSDEWTSKMR